MANTPPLTFLYRNWRGEVSTRRVIPLAAPQYGVTVWHPTPGWLLKAVDLDKGEVRIFAMKDMAAADAIIPIGDPWGYLCTSPKFAAHVVGAREDAEDHLRRSGHWTVEPLYRGAPLPRPEN